MTHDAIIEAAARALKDWSDPAEARRVAAAILTAVAPLIRAEVLEEAAKIVEDYDDFSVTEIAAVIRALTEQP